MGEQHRPSPISKASPQAAAGRQRSTLLGCMAAVLGPQDTPKPADTSQDQHSCTRPFRSGPGTGGLASPRTLEALLGGALDVLTVLVITLVLLQPGDSDWPKPALTLLIKLVDIGFVGLNFLMTKILSAWPNKDKRSPEPAQEAIRSLVPRWLIAPGDGVIGHWDVGALSFISGRH